MQLSEFRYNLPKHLIAQSAVHPPDTCKFLVLNKSSEHKQFKDIINYLQPGDVLVVNKTKVSHAKLLGKKTTGGKIEVILTKPLGNNSYECRIKGSNIHAGTQLLFPSASATVREKINDIFTIQFRKTPSKKDLIVPTPPYIKKKVPEKDYQTMFAKTEGSLAAPTAALHFTHSLVRKLKKKGIKFAEITLHIGFGTFLPIRDLNNPKTEPEFFEITKKNAEIINNATRLIPVGTTSLKTLESAAKNGKVHPRKGHSPIFIQPGYQFKLNYAAMITNFHLPKSSLFMLVCAFGGTRRILRAYREAIQQKYRFYSLGDGMLVFKVLKPI
jgi:S-adenosylmethionine:tRNA ribosyltransferase-isomerase